MKFLNLLFVLFTANFLYAQNKVVDTNQVVTPNRVNTEQTLQKPYVILISADGFRYDYFKKYKAKNLLNIAAKGVWAKKGMHPSYPSITFPNHYSIITGLYPSHHGIVDNIFYDSIRKETYKIGSKTVIDGTWYNGLPLWALAEKQGMLSASLFWVGSESNAANTRPTYWYHYHEKFKDDAKVNIIKNWLTLPDSIRPHFITLYFPEVDYYGHKFGPDAKETEASVHYIDVAIKKLVDSLQPLNLPINFIFVSDHGMIAVEEKDYIPLPEIDSKKFTVINSYTLVRVTAKDKLDVLPLYQKLLNEKTDDYNVYLANNFPEKLNYSSREDTIGRIGDILLVPVGSKLLVNKNKKPTYGKHGFNSYEIPEMKASFIAWGENFKKGKKIKTFQNIHIYPLVASILDLEILQPIDGSLKVLQKTIR
ncbi:MAG TPA: ectonucleotide pyrophosphatase/phosphodiesterase [Chitinophagaceae bacterium]|nr:ectonucleotide pyrophosphatase/phosphodiesterase [Chitinophagaceae bacterium]